MKTLNNSQKELVAMQPQIIPAYQLVCDLMSEVTEIERLREYGRIWTALGLLETVPTDQYAHKWRRIQILWEDLGWTSTGKSAVDIARQILDIAYEDGYTDEA